MVNIEKNRPGSKFYAGWVLYSIVGGLAAFIAYVLIAKTYNALAGG